MPSSASPRSGPSLRIEELAITHFRTFTTRTVIPFRGNAAELDTIATFHGDNGSGKSNALVALDLFFSALVTYLGSSEMTGGKDATIGWYESAPSEFALASRDRPPGAEGPTDLEVHFADERLGVLRVRFTPAGNRVRLRADRGWKLDSTSPLEFLPIRSVERDQFLTWIETPFGPGSGPCDIINAQRQHKVRPGSSPTASLDTELAEALFKLRTSFAPHDRDRWRGFTQMLEGFEAFHVRELSVDRLAPSGAPELTFEERGRVVLSMKDLSSGEQQLVRLCAVATLVNTAILAIEEPELSLDFNNQGILLAILRTQVEAGLRDQIILESHVPTFDGPSVIRFSRGSSGETQVTRTPSVTSATHQETSRRAAAQGAQEQWVTRDGYTRLPELMRTDLKLTQGGHLWFLKGKSAWEAWREEDLAALLAETEKDEGNG
jgi:hypothetical protein